VNEKQTQRVNDAIYFAGKQKRQSCANLGVFPLFSLFFVSKYSTSQHLCHQSYQLKLTIDVMYVVGNDVNKHALPAKSETAGCAGGIRNKTSVVAELHAQRQLPAGSIDHLLYRSAALAFCLSRLPCQSCPHSATRCSFAFTSPV